MAMTLAAVKAEVENWYPPLLGKVIDADGAYPGQCVDLIHRYGIDLHGHPSTWGNGDALADNLIKNRGYARVPVSSTWQIGDVVSKWTGWYGGHVFIVLEDLGASVRYLDQNGTGSADEANGPITIRTAKKANILAVARPPRYVGAKAVTVPVPVVSATDVLTSGGLFNAAAIVAGSKAAGVPLHIAAAIVEKESLGRNIYGRDSGGIHSSRPNGVTVDGVTYAPGDLVPVSRDSYLVFLSRLLRADGSWTGVKSNGVGPMQITYWGYHRDARRAGVDLSNPAKNIEFGLRILAGHLNGSYTQYSVERAGTLYNAGTLANGVNGYGRDLWAKSEKWRVQLAGSTIVDDDDGETVIVPENPETPEPAPMVPGPPLPGGQVETVTDDTDPGPRPSLAAVPDAEVKPLPAIPPAPLTTGVGLMSKPMERIRWRDEWWYATRWETDWEQGIPGPDQAPWGSGMVSATGSITLTQPVPLLQRHGWNPWRDNIPVAGEPVLVEVSMNGGDTWHRVFTGKVDSSAGAVNDFEVTMRVSEHVDRLATAESTVSIMPKNFRMPSPVNGERYMSIGLHAACVTAEAAAEGGFRATPHPHYAATIMAAPMLGTMWPSIGVLESSRTIVPKSASTTTTSDSPDFVRTWWGLTVTNTWSCYRPVAHPSATLRLDQSKAIRCFVAPVKEGPAFIELWWRNHSIMLTVDWRGITVETQDGWRTDPGKEGWRNVLYGRTRPLSDEVKAKGFDLVVWLGKDRSLSISVDGAVSNHTPFPSYPREATSQDMSQIRVTTRPGATQIGAVQVYSTEDRSVVEPFTRNLILDVDTEDSLFGVPAVEGVLGLDLLREQAEKLLVTTYMDEVGRLWSVGRSRMDARKSVRTLTEHDIAKDPAPRWAVGRASVFSGITGTHMQPAASQTRMASAAATDVWEGPSDTLRPGETWEDVATPPDGVDWIYVDHAPTKIGAANIDLVNRDVGSVLGGTTRQSDSAGKVEEGLPSVTWFNGEAVRESWKAYPVEVRYTPPEGVVARFQLSAPKVEGLSARYEGVGFLLRARARVAWKKFPTPRPLATNAEQYDGSTYEHDGGWHIQSPAVMDKVRIRLAQQFSQPLPAHASIGVARPDPAITRASTITLSLDGISTPHRVVGVRWEGGPDGIRQTLALRQIRP